MFAVWFGKRVVVVRRFLTYRRVRPWGMWTPLMRIYRSVLPTRQLRRLAARKPWALWQQPKRIVRKDRGEFDGKGRCKV